MRKIKTDDWPDRTCNRCNLTYAAAERCCPNCCCPEFRLTDGDLADLDDEAREMSDAEFDKADEEDLDVLPCSRCGEPVRTVPEGLALCNACAQLTEQEIWGDGDEADEAFEPWKARDPRENVMRCPDDCDEQCSVCRYRDCPKRDDGALADQAREREDDGTLGRPDPA